MHWWDEETVNAKKESIASRRRWSRAKKHLCRNDSTEIREEVELLEMQYREAKKKLRNKIKAAKILAWRELIKDVDRDPWGLPYKIVLKKLRMASPTLTETLGEVDAEKLVASLFPDGEDITPNLLPPME